MNTFLDARLDTSNDRLRATLAGPLERVIEYQMPEGNTFLVATSSPHALVSRKQ